MPTTRTATAKTSRTTTNTRRAAAKEPNAVDLLIADHKLVKKLFKQFEKAAKADDNAGKVAIAKQICQELTVHAQVEEELFYPEAHAVLKEHDLVDEATVEHATAKQLIAEIEGMKGSEHLYDAKVKVLGEYIDHHVKEEEEEMFPKIKRAKLDLESIGEAIVARKEQLQAELSAKH